MRKPAARKSATLRSFVFLLLVAIVTAPISSMMLMSGQSAVVRTGQALDAAPCPMHGAAAASGLPHSDSRHEQTKPQSSGDPDCYCGIFCHAVMAGIAGPDLLPVAGRAIVPDGTPMLLHGLWPQPLPRPPQA